MNRIVVVINGRKNVPSRANSKNKNYKTCKTANQGIHQKKIENGDSKRYFHTHGDSSVVHNSRKVEATQVSIAR